MKTLDRVEAIRILEENNIRMVELTESNTAIFLAGKSYMFAICQDKIAIGTGFLKLNKKNLSYVVHMAKVQNDIYSLFKGV